MTFILASSSPQRSTILERLGYAFDVIPSDVDESAYAESDPVARAVLLATEKARSVSVQHPDRWVIGVDTLVVSHDGQLLEKPVDEDDARRMLALHSGATSTIHSGICLCKSDQVLSDIASARVTFRTLDQHTINWWIETGLWRGRSGSFQLEGEGERLVASVDGESETIIGFPVRLFGEMCEELGIGKSGSGFGVRDSG